MKLEKVVVNVEKTFGELLFLGTGEALRAGRGRSARIVGHTYNLSSDVQPADNIEVIVMNPQQKSFDYEDKIELVNPHIEAGGRIIGGRAYVDYKLYAEDIKKTE